MSALAYDHEGLSRRQRRVEWRVLGTSWRLRCPPAVAPSCTGGPTPTTRTRFLFTHIIEYDPFHVPQFAHRATVCDNSFIVGRFYTPTPHAPRPTVPRPHPPPPGPVHARRPDVCRRRSPPRRPLYHHWRLEHSGRYRSYRGTSTWIIPHAIIPPSSHHPQHPTWTRTRNPNPNPNPKPEPEPEPET